jgi:hypothetical protein
LLTIRQQRWLTRQVAVQNGTVVRTEQPAEDTQSERSSQEAIAA